MQKKESVKAKQDKSATSFATLYWEAFERLSMKIIEDIYKGKPNVVHKLTSSRNDGGYDGILCFPVVPSNASKLYKILLEAKLRSSSKHDLPLSDFSKTIIIAINTIADKVYISTNAYFSAETNRRLQTYAQRTGLEITTLDVNSIADWIKNHRIEAEELCDSEFLDVLTGMERPLNPNQRILTFEPEKLVLETTETAELIGNQRKKLLNLLSQTLSTQDLIVIIQAVEGAGKTFFIEKLIQELHQNYRRIAYLDLNSFSDVRQVFLQLLSIAWGIGTGEIYGMSNEDLSDVTKYLGDDAFPPKSRSTLINMIHQPQEQFVQNLAVHIDLLLDYLHLIFPPILKRVRFLLVISNLDSATQKALDFLCSFIKKVSDSPISFVVKEDNREFAIKSSSVTHFLSEIKRINTYYDTVTLPEWTSTDALQFLDSSVPWLTNDDKRQLIDFFGTLPLALSAGAEIFRNSNLGKVIALSGIGLPSSIAQFRFSLGCIDRIVEEYAMAGGSAVQCGLILLGLFDGSSRILMIEKIVSNLGFSSPIPALCMCPFLKKVQDNILVLHGSYRSSIQKFSFVTRPFLYTVLTEIEPILENYFEDLEYVLRKRFFILKLTKDFEKLRNTWMPLTGIHLSHGEPELVYEVLKTVYELWMQNLTVHYLTSYEQYWLLYHLSEAVLTLQGSGASELQCYIEQLDAVLQLAPEVEWPQQLLSLRLAKAETLNMKCQNALGQADYQNMLCYAEQGIALLRRHLTAKELYCLGKLWASKAIAVKHLKNLTACIGFLESGKKQLLGVEPFTFCYYTHLASCYSTSHPRKALIYFQKIKQECDCSLSQILHTDHNIATMHFILGEYEEAAELSGRVWTKAYENNIFIEEGRSDHLLGCIAWVRDNLEYARERFLASYKMFQTYTHRTHLWPPLINLSTLCIEMGKEFDALFYTRKAIEFLLEYHLDNINHLDITAESLPKIYVGVLLLLDNCARLSADDSLKEQLLEQVTLPEVHAAYETYIVSNRLDDLLKGSGYICHGKRVLKV